MTDSLKLLEKFIPKQDIPNIKKIAISYTEMHWLKIITFNSLNIHKKYTLKVTNKMEKLITKLLLRKKRIC